MILFANYKKKAPKLLGESSPQKVAKAVIRAIKEDIREIIVNPRPIWPMMIMDAIHPELVGWVLRKFGIYKFYKQQALDNEQLELQ